MPNRSRPNVLYLVHRVPYPPDKGDRIRNYHILSWLSRRAAVHLACLADEAVSDEVIQTLERLTERVAVARIEPIVRYAGAARSLVQGRTATEGAFESATLRRLLSGWVSETRFDVILASASSMAPYLRHQALRDVPRVVDFVDVDSQKWLDYAGTCSGPRSWLYRTEGNRLRRLEQDISSWARGTIFVSDAEANLFRDGLDVRNVHTVPNGVDLDSFHPNPETAISDRTCVFVGALDYRPNIDGVCWFCRAVWPEIYRQRPGARLLLVGRQPVPAVRQLAAVAGVELVGQVPDVRAYLFGATLVVVPLRLARGVQNKVLEALATGKATVASPQSLAGLRTRGSVPVLSASTPTEWVESVIRLMDDPTERQRLAVDGRRYVEKFHHWDKCLEPLEMILGLPNVPGREAVDPIMANLTG
jgi:polysaccharide biosynthesis protein PslH